MGIFLKKYDFWVKMDVLSLNLVGFFFVKFSPFLPSQPPPPPPTPPPPPDSPNFGGISADFGEPRLEDLGLGGSTPVGLIQNLLEFLHLDLGLPWWGAIAAGGWSFWGKKAGIWEKKNGDFWRKMGILGVWRGKKMEI